MRVVLISLLSLALASPALAGPVTLKAQPSDEDGRITLGELFDGAGAAAAVVVGARTGPSAVLDAGAVQAQAARAGLSWSNPQGLRRVVVRQGAAPTASTPSPTARPGATVEVLTYARSLATGDVVAPEDVVFSTVQAHQAPAGAPQEAEAVIGLSARRPLRAGAAVQRGDLTSPQVIARNDAVEVAYMAGGVTLTVTGRAQRPAALGEAVTVLNPASGKTIEAVATGPGKAIAGPLAASARQSSLVR